METEALPAIISPNSCSCRHNEPPPNLSHSATMTQLLLNGAQYQFLDFGEFADASKAGTHAVFGHPAGEVARVRLPVVHAGQHPVAVGGIQAPNIEDVVENVLVQDLRFVTIGENAKVPNSGCTAR